MINKKKLIAYAFVAVMVCSAFAGLASIIPPVSNTGTAVHISPATGSSGAAMVGIYAIFAGLMLLIGLAKDVPVVGAIA